ncbi:MAG: L-fucose mutarotase [Verrucomicrobiota bacterium]
MLKGISPLLSPELLHTLCRMGHGDTIVLADAHFPGDSFNSHVIRADGHGIAPLLAAILPWMVLDQYVDEPVEMMAAVAGDSLDPAVQADYLAAMRPHVAQDPRIKMVDRFPFYEEARKAFAVVMTGELRKYGNVILRKGVTPV